MLIPHVEMSENRKLDLQNQIAKANKIFIQYYSQVATNKGRMGFVTSNNDKLNRSRFFNQIVDAYSKDKSSDVCLHGMVISNKDAEMIYQVKQVQLEVLSSMSNLFAKIANSKIKIAKDFAISYEDLESEAIKCAIEAFCSYADENICFSTYFFNCVSRHLSAYCASSNPLSKLSKKAINLKRKFSEASRSFDNANFGEIISSMNLNKKDESILRSVLDCRRVESEKENLVEVLSKQDENNNFTESLDDVHLEKIEMTSLEKAVLDGFMSEGKINAFTRSVINPKTGKPYTRMAASLAWKRIKEKIKNHRRAA